MSNRGGKSANVKKRRKYEKGKLCPECKRGKFKGCDQEHKDGHERHIVCETCGSCNF